MLGHSQTKERETGNPNLSLHHRATSRLYPILTFLTQAVSWNLSFLPSRTMWKRFSTLRPSSTVVRSVATQADERHVVALHDEPHIVERPSRVGTVVATGPHMTLRGKAEPRNHLVRNHSDVRAAVELATQHATPRAADRVENHHVSNRRRRGERAIVRRHAQRENSGDGSSHTVGVSST